jgi:hypothetical protein
MVPARRRPRSWVVGAATVATALLLLGAAGCGGDPPGDGFALHTDQLRRSPTDPVRPEGVQTAIVRPEVQAVEVRREPPAGIAAPAALTLGGAHLTPIPSPALNWGSAATDGGWSYDNPTRIGSPLVFLVTRTADDWVEVMIPARPNGQRGWVRRDHVRLDRHTWRIHIDVGDNLLRVFEDDELRIETPTVDGTTSTPTPLGRFYVNEKQQQPETSVYGPWIISTNGFSDALERFSGEVPIFAVHGTNNPGAMGQDRSNGCVRVPNHVVQYLAEHVPVGTPIDVSA